MSSTTTEITVAGVGLTIEYVYHKGRRGARDSFMGKAGAGPQIEPDEEPEIEIQSVKSYEDIYELLPNKIIEQVEEKIWESLQREREE